MKFDLSRNTKGSIAMIVGIALPVILLILVLTVDLGKMQNEHINNQSAVDAAAYSTAEFVESGRIEQLKNDQRGWNTWVPSKEKLDAYALNILSSNAMSDQNAATVNTSRFDATYDVKTDSITVESCMTVNPDKLASTMGLGEMHPVCSKATARLICRPSQHTRTIDCPGGGTVIETTTITPNPNGIGCKSDVRTPSCPGTLNCGSVRSPETGLFTIIAEGDQCRRNTSSGYDTRTRPPGGTIPSPAPYMEEYCVCAHDKPVIIHGGGSTGGVNAIQLQPGSCGCDTGGQGR